MSYVPNTDADRAAMLAAIGLPSVEDLFADIPAAARRPRLTLPRPLSEPEVLAELRALANRNADLNQYACFLGAGSYHHFIPSVVGHVTGRSEFYTSYTPYQPEVSQGTLQCLFEFQSLVCALTGLDAANAGHYDGATALAEAALMAVRLTGRSRVGIHWDVHPEYLGVLRTYLAGLDLAIEQIADPEQITEGLACVLVQQPSFLGTIGDLRCWSERAHAAGALLAVHVNPISLGLLAPPGQLGADIVTAEAQPLGQAPAFGGPYAGIFACRAAHVRQRPGRVCGLTTDRDGRRGFVLTLQAREQHIRRERATSNICTNQALIALGATVYLAVMGKHGLRKVAEICYNRAHYLAQRIAHIPGYQVITNEPFFNEFAIRCPIPPAELNRRLLARQIIGGLDISGWGPEDGDVAASTRGAPVDNAMLVCVTELNTKAEIDRFVEVLSQVEVTV